MTVIYLCTCIVQNKTRKFKKVILESTFYSLDIYNLILLVHIKMSDNGYTI